MPRVRGTWPSVVNLLVAEADVLNCQLLVSAFRPKRLGIQVVEATTAPENAITVIKERCPDVAVISGRLKTGPFHGFALARNIRSVQPSPRVIMLLDSREPQTIIDAFRSGARGVIFRDEPVEVLAKSIHAVHSGQIWANSLHLGYLVDAFTKMPEFAFSSVGTAPLTKREEDVVKLIAEGMTNRQISQQLSLSEHTVRNYLFHIFDKLGISNRSELILYFFHSASQQQ